MRQPFKVRIAKPDAVMVRELGGESVLLLGTIDYTTAKDSDFTGAAELVATRAGTAHGLCVWFDATLAEGVHFSNAPGCPDLIYGRAYFPWPTRVEGKAAFKQSNFFAEPLSPVQLRKTAASHVPSLNEDGIIDQLSLELMRERTPLGDIARRLAARFPQRFARWQDALTHVGELSAKYSR